MWTGFRARKGFILVAVLMAATVLLSVAAGFAWFARGQLRRVEAERRTLVARNVAFLAAMTAARGLELDKNDFDSLREPWFQPFGFPADDQFVQVAIKPLDDKLPLNRLFLPDGTTLRTELDEPFRTALERLGRSETAPLILDFLDPDATPRLGGGEKKSFLNRSLGDLSELLLCPGVVPRLVDGPSGPAKAGVRDLFTLWSGGKVNVNVASPDILTLLHPSITEQVAETIVRERKKQPFDSFEDLGKIAGFPKETLPRLMNLIDVKSSCFGLEIRVFEGKGSVRMFDAILEKASDRVRIVAWRERL